MFTDICPKCQTQMSVGNTTVQCPLYNCYLYSVMGTYTLERFSIDKYTIFNVLSEYNGLYCEIHGPAGEQNSGSISIYLLLMGQYISYNKITKEKIEKYLLLS